MKRIGDDARVDHVVDRNRHVVPDGHRIVVGIVTQVHADLGALLHGSAVQLLVALGDHGVPAVRPHGRAEGYGELRGRRVGVTWPGWAPGPRAVDRGAHAAEHVVTQARVDVGRRLQRHRDSGRALRITPSGEGREDAHVFGHLSVVAAPGRGHALFQDHAVDVRLGQPCVLNQDMPPQPASSSHRGPAASAPASARQSRR